MEKETLSLYKIKKDLMNMVISDSKTILLVSIILLPLMALVLVLYNRLSKDVSIILHLFIMIPVILFLVTIIFCSTYLITQAIQIKKGKFILETDELIGKEEETPKSFRSIYYRPYRLYFKCNEKFDIPVTKSYKWSRLYSMREKDIYLTSETGDIFLLVKMNKGIAMVYNTKYFELSTSLL